MKVRELQELLSKLDPDLDLVGYCEDTVPGNSDAGFVVFDIDGADACQAEWTRLSNGTPYLRFDNSDASEKLVAVHLLADF